MSETSLFYWNEQLGKSCPRVSRFVFNITAAVTASPLPQHSAALLTFGAISAQSTIDDHLGTTNEFLIAAFDATSMGADTCGLIVNMGGQVRTLVHAVARCWSATGGGTLVTRQVQPLSAGLTATSLATELAKGTNGNVAMKVDWGNTPDFDALTAATMQFDFYWIAK